MKAIVQDRFGSADVLELRDVPEPVVGDDQVLVSVRAAGCGPDVWHIMAGKPYMVRPIPEVRRAMKAPRGRDVAGVIERVGAAVTGFAPGDEVIGVVEGSFAEFVAGSPAKLARKPAALSWEEAGALPISGVTALQALRDAAEVQPGQRVLIVGAGGGVGTFAVQIAKALGAHVTGVCSGAKADLVHSLGADDVIDYTREDFTDGARRWDVIVDTAGRRPLRKLRRALTPKGTLVIVGGDGGGRWTGGFGRQMLRAPLLSLLTGQRLRPVLAEGNHDDLEILAKMVEDGEMRPVVDRTFALPDAAEAIRYLERGHAAGKVVVTA
ncbi:MAG TPA: NAD(P)-dependent alcohol dehydrogenase [Actinomycetota bacterium]|nr:NAD(P)-dependent alcohol dehydrogenase [Actinomycetota bacterium]